MADKYQQALQQYFGYDDFRGIQRDIIESIGHGYDTLGLMPTGGGKSITFQVPALCMAGVCVVITPLIALMKDQVAHLRQRGILAAAVYSGMQHDDVLRVLDNCILGRTKFLYVSPERLSSELFVAKLRHMNISFITVDEAHCISQWGYDFRPSYLRIAQFRLLRPQVPVLALTATATKEVVMDIARKLQRPDDKKETEKSASLKTILKEKIPFLTKEDDERKVLEETRFHVFRMSFERKNLTYFVQYTEDKRGTLVRLLQQYQGAAIVYVRSRRRAKEMAECLQAAGHNATFYHAGLEHEIKDQRQRDWQDDKIRVIVATNAFGMGIDKADVRLVIHFDSPDSVEAYFQEAGRAGRDGQPALAMMLYNRGDTTLLRKRIAETFPEKDYIRKVYDHLAFYYQIALGDGMGFSRAFDMDDFCVKFKHFPISVHAALQILQRAGYIEYAAEQENEARVYFLLGRDDLYRLHGNLPEEDRLIEALLRCYTGLFVDDVYINENTLAKVCDTTPVKIHETLKQLSRKRIIRFIPRRHTPYIRYTMPREDGKHLRLTAEVYDNRLKQYKQRIDAMIDYLENNHECRSRQLLKYFGEKHAEKCGRCDVCNVVTKEDIEKAKQDILNLLADGKKHHAVEVKDLNLRPKAQREALHYLVDEELIFQESIYLYRKI